jgi:hypothetical protein
MAVLPIRVRVVLVVSALALAAGLLALASLATPTQAQNSTPERVPINQGYYNECTGESFQIDGTLLIVDHFTTDASGGNHAQAVETIQGTAENLTTGVEYAYKDRRVLQFNFTGDTSTYHDSYVVTMRRQGSTTPDDDLKSTIFLKLTAANEEIRTEIVKFEFSCN